VSAQKLDKFIPMKVDFTWSLRRDEKLHETTHDLLCN
jgi:hypothetical protein